MGSGITTPDPSEVPRVTISPAPTTAEPAPTLPPAPTNPQPTQQPKVKQNLLLFDAYTLKNIYTINLRN